MAHHIYRSQGVVLAGRDAGEANRMLRVFTRELGLINVIARGLRREVSKLRYVLQTGSWVDANFVRGKEGWILTTALPTEPRVPKGISERRMQANVLKTLARFLPHNEPHAQLFDELDRFLSVLHAHPTHAREWELVFLVRMLQMLGYWGKDVPEAFLEPMRYDLALPALVTPEYPHVTKEINEVLQHVHT